ncbi:hypothetical protein [Actinomadura bangladeshensis]|uniref:Uncharacterized protein n=1 Tax=Actinomadura bangladeshensis TaxID=453573 RepID=A0A6L9QMM0_9ACTN|nr:hypothetical protein [Actinomadura bangladeshensis]NEA26740.1 hypothetical protein [Actinomadura bangladeshensis]
MWPGSNVPMGPPPVDPGRAAPSWPPPRRGPGAGWYALPVALVAVAVVGFFTLVGFLWEDSEVANGPPSSGDPAAGVPIRLSEGHDYFVYVRTGGSTPYACSVRAGQRFGPIRLTRKNSWSASDRAGYRYTATFTAPVTGDAVLTCRGTDGPVMVTPDDTAHAYLGLALFTALGLGGLAVLSFVVVLVRRSAARR